MNLAHNLEVRGEALVELATRYEHHSDAWYRGYSAALDAVGRGLLQMVEDERTVRSGGVPRRRTLRQGAAK